MHSLIQVNEQEKSFHLTNGKVSYIFRVMEQTNVLEHLYFGKAIRPQSSYKYLIEREVRPSNNQIEGDHTTSLEHVKQEMPAYGTTDFRYPGVEVRYPEGDTLSQWEYAGHEQQDGKPVVKGLPMTFTAEEEAETLVILLKDRYSELELRLFYTVFRDRPVITRSAQITNHGQETYTLNRLMSLSLDLPDADYELVHLHGAWARETHVERKPLVTGVQAISSTRGASSHVHNPFLALARPSATELQGEVLGFSLVYSGNFLGQVEVDTYHVARVMLGVNSYQFAWKMSPGETFQTPEAVMTYSDQGLNGMSQTFQKLYHNHLVNPKWAHRPRPVLINNWEATYFNFNEDKILEIAEEAKGLGIDLLVLDDGWFGHRDDDASSLGNWIVDQGKLPNGIAALAEKVHAKGLQFGLWFEPEMLSKDTLLYQEHPDWIIGRQDKRISHGRNQYVLDFSRPEVVEAIFRQMDTVLDGSGIDYVKWDMNRYISEAYSSALASDQQGELFHRYILGVYDLYEKLLDKYPDLLIESCAGGGGRFDPALLYYAPQTWASDDTDAVERLKIQYGASYVYPLSAIGSHVSAVPNHQIGRITSLKMRGDVALFGTFGYELDPTVLSEVEKAEVQEQIQNFKLHQHLIHEGDFYRLLSPFAGNETAWMVVSQDRKEALVGFYQVLAKPNPAYQRVKLVGLEEGTAYRINGSGQLRYGDDLMNVGLILAEDFTGRANDYWAREKEGDFTSSIFYLQAD